MSFFYNFLESIEIDDFKNKIICSLIFGSAIKIMANIKIENLQEDEIVLVCNKTRIKILGEELKIFTLTLFIN